MTHYIKLPIAFSNDTLLQTFCFCYQYFQLVISFLQQMSCTQSRQPSTDNNNVPNFFSHSQTLEAVFFRACREKAKSETGHLLTFRFCRLQSLGCQDVCLRNSVPWIYEQKGCDYPGKKEKSVTGSSWRKCEKQSNRMFTFCLFVSFCFFVSQVRTRLDQVQ